MYDLIQYIKENFEKDEVELNLKIEYSVNRGCSRKVFRKGYDIPFVEAWEDTVEEAIKKVVSKLK